jgi:pimeloyl-ACP methyl ester carboxylesterase
MLWFRIGTFGLHDAETVAADIAIDTGAAVGSKSNWWGDHNKDFTFDRLIRARLTRTGSSYTGTVTTGDATGTGQKHVRIDGDAIVIGIARTEITDKTTMTIVAAIGASEEANDDIPHTRPIAIDVLAPRPARGLREIDTSRNNFASAGNQPILRDSAPPRIVESGRGSTPMVLIPGVYSGNAPFDGFVARNAARYAFYTITPPGLAGTPARALPAETVSYGDLTWTRRLARDIADLIERKRLDKPIIVVHGFPGSLAAEELAASQSDRIGGIVEVASTAVQPFPSLTNPGREATPAQRVAIVDDSWARQWFKYVTPETWESNNYRVEMFLNDAARGERARRQVEANPLPVKIRYLAENMASDHRSLFGLLDVPVLIMKPGFNDALLAEPSFAWFKASFLDGWKAYPENPRVEQITIPDARALMLDDQPDAADRAIALFVERVRRASRGSL